MITGMKKPGYAKFEIKGIARRTASVKEDLEFFEKRGYYLFSIWLENDDTDGDGNACENRFFIGTAKDVAEKHVKTFNNNSLVIASGYMQQQNYEELTHFECTKLEIIKEGGVKYE